MDSFLRQIKDSCVDDCAVFSDEWHDQLEHLDKYLSTMRHEHITLKSNLKANLHSAKLWIYRLCKPDDLDKTRLKDSNSDYLFCYSASFS